MINKGKYLVGKIVDHDGIERTAAVIFPEYIIHSALRRLFVDGPVSGGFFMIDECISESMAEVDFIVSAFGESTSCGVRANKETDIALLRQALGFIGDKNPQ
jgi:hypothetical protein